MRMPPGWDWTPGVSPPLPDTLRIRDALNGGFQHLPREVALIAMAFMSKMPVSHSEALALARAELNRRKAGGRR